MLWLFLTGGYLSAAVLFGIAWKKRRPVRISLAVIAGGLVVAQTLVWHGLVRLGEAWHGKYEGIWIIWAVPVLLYCGLTTALLARPDTLRPDTLVLAKKPTPEEEYGPLR